MTNTEVFKQQQKLKGLNGVRTPYLAKASSKMQDLFIAIGKSRFITKFSALEGSSKTILRVWLRQEEQQNVVVIAAIKSLFNHFPNTKFPDDFSSSNYVQIEIQSL